MDKIITLLLVIANIAIITMLVLMLTGTYHSPLCLPTGFTFFDIGASQ